ncbi:MAG TPA: lysylphosphatidylglycerol synthase transmembrane domain-containing protein [Gemmatimonadales bacterium]|nr:lysylphosphatidylglycerol synthase transmembrane domain-containing protein [Gemmatimonadales bacterium]
MRRLLITGIGIAVTLGLLYWVLRGTSLSEVAGHLRSARAGPLLVAVLLATATFGIRTIRWRVLLRTPDGGPVGWGPLWHATAMGFMANNTLPFRLGEVVRSYAGSRLGGVPLATALSSIAVERALDGLTLVGLLGVALFRAGLPAETVVMGARLDAVAARAGILCAVIFAGALFVVLLPLTAERLVRALLPFPRLADRVVSLIENLRRGFGALRSPSRLGAAVFWSLAHWLLNAAAFFIAFAAFDIRVDFAGALLVQSLLAFGIAAPSTPGYFGVFEVVVAAALALFGVPAAVGVAYGITYHIATFVPITLMGLWSLARSGLRVRDATGTGA